MLGHFVIKPIYYLAPGHLDAWSLCHKAIYYLAPGHLDAWPLFRKADFLFGFWDAYGYFVIKPICYLTPGHVDARPLKVFIWHLATWMLGHFVTKNAILLLNTLPPGCLESLSPSQFVT
jgi:hypothetical protein